jgi:hypothetical protein
MSSKSPPNNKGAAKAYAVGYGKPPKSGQFKPGQSGNPKGKPKGQPSLSEMVLAEAACIVKVKQGEEIIHLTKKQFVIRRLFDMAAKGNLAAARVLFEIIAKAEAAAEKSAPQELPLTEDEIALIKEMNQGGAGPS